MITADNALIVLDQIIRAVQMRAEAVSLCQEGRAKEAEPLFLSALELFEAHDGAESPDVAAVLCDLGAIAEERCDYEAALERFQRAADIIETISYFDGEDIRQLRLRV